MTTLEVGKQLVDLCNQGQNAKVYETLYDPEIVSVEAAGSPQELHGIDAVNQKVQAWNENHMVHSEICEGPYPNGDRFAVRFKFDMTDKDTNQRHVFEETAVYTVQNDKIVREEFFYAM